MNIAVPFMQLLSGYKGIRARLFLRDTMHSLLFVQPRNKYAKVLGRLFELLVKDGRDSVNRPRYPSQISQGQC